MRALARRRRSSSILVRGDPAIFCWRVDENLQSVVEEI